MKEIIGDSASQLKERLNRIVSKPNFVLAAEICLIGIVVLIIGFVVISAYQSSRMLKSIQVVTQPEQSIYVYGDALDTRGLTLELLYADGTKKLVSEGFSCKPTRLEAYGQQTITVQYGEHTAQFSVEVKERRASGRCGENLNWTLTKDSDLLITGTGDMKNYDSGNMPWDNYGVKTVFVQHGITSIAKYAFAGFGRLEQVQLPSTVIIIGKGAFAYCESLLAIDIPSGVKVIREGAFQSCVNLAEVTFHSGLNRIDANAFNGCRGLKSITLPDGLEEIRKYAFASCTALERVWIPASVKIIESGAFASTDKLKAFSVDPGNPYYCADKSGVLYSKDRKTLIRCPSGYAGSYVADPQCSVIEEYAFGKCGDLTAIALPEGLRNIKTYAFSYCIELTEVTVPASVKSIDSGAFTGCRALKRLTILNPKCKIEMSDRYAKHKLTVYGYVNSTAMDYAKEYDCLFIPILPANASKTNPGS